MDSFLVLGIFVALLILIVWSVLRGRLWELEEGVERQSAEVRPVVYGEVSGGLLTAACGIQGLARRARERILRLQGGFLLLACILKLFV